jgi:MFS family permease
MSRLVRTEIDHELELGSAEESSLQKIVDCQRHFRNLRGGTPSRGYLYDEYTRCFAVPDLAHFDNGIIAFLSVYTACRGPCRSREPQRVVMRHQCLVGSGSCRFGDPWLAASSQSLPDPDLYFFIGIGFAFNAPTWISIVAQIVSDTELPSAAALNGLQFNISGIIGPVLGGLLVASIGANFVFIANAACFLLVILSVLQWKYPKVLPKAYSETFCQSVGEVTRCIRCAPALQILLIRNFLFALFISAIPAVVPVLGLTVLHLTPSKLGLLFTSMGSGSAVAALFLIPWFRARFSSNALTLSANLLVILAYLLMGFVRQTELFLLVAALAGVGWTLSASELWLVAQRAIPDWARGRMNAAIMMISQGAMVIGGLIWGTVITIAGPGCTLLGVAVLFLISLLLSAPLSINFARKLERVSVA